MISRVLLFILIVVQISKAFAITGGVASGGGTPIIIEPEFVKFLLENGDLKNAMLNYFKTLKVDQIIENSDKHKLVKVIFKNALQDDLLQKDISTPNNYTFNKGCPEAVNPNEPSFACTKIGDLYGPVNFEVNKFAEYYKILSSEELMIRLASLAIHEHIHHFQTPSVELKKNDFEAYLISDYIKLTAKTVQVPMLEWDPKSTQKKQNNDLAVVKYYNQNDPQGLSGGFIRVTKTKDFELSYEKCLTNEKCVLISDRKLNLVEAWTWGEQMSSKQALPYYLTGIALVPIAFFVGGEGALAIPGAILDIFKLLHFEFVYYLNIESAEVIASVVGAIAAPTYSIYKVKSALTKATSPSYMAIQDNNYNDAIILQSMPISDLSAEMKIFIESAPRLKVSKAALQDWDSNN